MSSGSPPVCPGRAREAQAEQAQGNEEVKKKRLDLPRVRVEKEYEFDTEDGTKTLAELFDGRS